MFKAVLVIFVLGIGKGDDQKGGNVTVIPFQSMAQCEQALNHTKDVMKKWHYGKDKDKVVPVLNTMECRPIDAVPLDIPRPEVTVAAPECKPSGDTIDFTAPAGDDAWGSKW